MNLDDWHLAFVSSCILLSFSACIPLIIANVQRPEEQFLSLATLGKSGMLEDYYPNNVSVALRDRIQWIVNVYNHMGEAKYVALRIKLLNSTLPGPNSSSCSPSASPAIYEARRVVLDEESWDYAFTWSILGVESSGEYVEIKSISVNDEAIDTQAVALGRRGFRIVVELWVYDEASEEFRFGWIYREEFKCAWNQIWFDTAGI